jgi:hypothetical protein
VNELHDSLDFQLADGSIAKMPPLPIEIVPGSMGLLQAGPVTIPIHSAVAVSVRSDVTLFLRRVNLETLNPGLAKSGWMNTSYCEIDDIKVGDVTKKPYEDLGLIRVGEFLHIIFRNLTTQLMNARVIVSGDGVRETHWGIYCKERHGNLPLESDDCPSCRWRTSCHHVDCELIPEMAWRCQEQRENAYLAAVDVTSAAALNAAASILTAREAPPALPAMPTMNDDFIQLRIREG